MEVLLPGRSWKMIRTKALSEGLQRESFSHSLRRNGDMSTLLSGSVEASYWLGFLTADGHFSQCGMISVQLSTVDRKHLEKLASFVGSAVHDYDRSSEVRVRHLEVCRSISGRFHFTNRKTYECPVLPEMTDEQFIAYLAGFIDGDGHISAGKQGSIRVKLHGSWLVFLERLSDRYQSIFGTTPSVWLNGGGRAVMDILGFETIGELKRRVLALGVPVMERKWSKIDEDRIGQVRRRSQNIKLAHSLRATGMLQREIAEAIGVSQNTVWRYLKESVSDLDWEQ